MITGTLHVFHLHAYVLFNPKALLSFVTPYIAINFNVSPKIIVEPFSISTSMGKSIIARWVYINCPVTVSQKITLVDFMELELTNLDVILGIDWLTHAMLQLTIEIESFSFSFPMN